MPSSVEKVAIVAIIVLLLTGATASLVLMVGEPPPVKEGLDLSRISLHLRSRSLSIISSAHDMSAEQIASAIESDITSYLSSDLVRYEGGRLTVRSVSAAVREGFLPVGSNYPPETVLTRKGQSYPNSELSGSSGSLMTLPVLKAKVTVWLEVLPEGERTPRDGHMILELVSMDPDRTLLSLMEMTGADMDGWGSGMARDLEYMLNSLVRFRTVRMGIGTRPFDTALSILNEGDVELAYNIAMGLAITRWTGVMPSDLLGNIDRFYSEQDLEVRMNPTGSRVWGEAERDTFVSYRERTAASGSPRSIKEIMGSVLIAGHSDTADIFLRYLHLDTRTSSSERLDPLDDKGPLEELDMLNSRQRKDPYDTYSLEHHPSYPTVPGIELPPGTFPSADEIGEGQLLIAKIGPTRGYSVVGRELRVSGLNDYKAWFTNADPSLNESDLIAYGFPADTRCGAVLPPPEPPTHDYRIQWDLTLNAVLNLTGTIHGHVGSSLPQDPVTLEVPVSFPIRVHSWFLREPNRDGGLRLTNINTGKQELTPISTRWVITAKANATEYFERYSFQDIREGISAGTSLLRSLSYRERVLGPEGIRYSAQVNAVSTLPALNSWSQKGELGRDLAILYHAYIKSKGLTPTVLGTIDTDGLSMRLDYLQAKDRMDVTVKAPEGSLVLSVLSVSSERPEPVLRVTTPQGLEVTVEPTRGVFRVEGTSESVGFRDGTMAPSQPTAALRDVLLQDTALLLSVPSGPASSVHPSSPYDPSRADVRERPFSRPAVRLVIVGGPEQIEEMDKDLPSLAGNGSSLAGLSAAGFAELMSVVSGTGLWAGLVAVWSGENGTAPIVRTLLFRTSGPVDDHIFRPALQQALWSPYPDLRSLTRGEAKGSIEVIICDRVPSWVLPGTGSSEGSDIILSAHLRYELGADAELVSVNVFEQVVVDAPNYGAAMFGWTAISQKAASPLW